MTFILHDVWPTVNRVNGCFHVMSHFKLVRSLVPTSLCVIMHLHNEMKWTCQNTESIATPHVYSILCMHAHRNALLKRHRVISLERYKCAHREHLSPSFASLIDLTNGYMMSMPASAPRTLFRVVHSSYLASFHKSRQDSALSGTRGLGMVVGESKSALEKRLCWSYIDYGGGPISKWGWIRGMSYFKVRMN
jgi:hypothetical protein